MKMSSPTIAGILGKKQTDPIINEMFPSITKKHRREPRFFKGLNGLKFGYIKIPRRSEITKKHDPMMNNIPPNAGLNSSAIEGQ